MSGTDKDKPARVKIAQGEKKPRGYVAQCAFYAGRDSAWREEAKAQSGRDRSRLRNDLIKALDDEEHDVLPPPPNGTAWVVY